MRACPPAVAPVSDTSEPARPPRHATSRRSTTHTGDSITAAGEHNEHRDRRRGRLDPARTPLQRPPTRTRRHREPRPRNSRRPRARLPVSTAPASTAPRLGAEAAWVLQERVVWAGGVTSVCVCGTAADRVRVAVRRRGDRCGTVVCRQSAASRRCGCVSAAHTGCPAGDNRRDGRLVRRGNHLGARAGRQGERRPGVGRRGAGTHRWRCPVSTPRRRSLADQRGRLQAATGRTLRLRGGRLSMRTVFWLTALIICAGLVYVISVGVLHR